MNIKILEELGLTENETTIYLTLIQDGTSSANAISEKTGMHRSYIYDTLSKMVNKGLVSYVTKSGKKNFKGVNPSKFKDIIREKEEKITKLIPDLLKIYKQEKSEYKIEVLEGKEGLKTYLNDLFDYVLIQDNVETLQLGRKISMEDHLMKYYRTNLEKKAKKLGLMKKVKQGKIKSRALLDHAVKNKKLLIKKIMPYRYLPKGFDTGGKDLTIVGNKVAIESLDGKPFAIVITNHGIANFYKNQR